MPSQAEIQKEITNRIIDGLKNGVVPWRKTWSSDKNCGAPANVISHRNYSGINPILLDLVGMSRGFTSKWWGTYQQWASLGANVRKRPDNVKPGQWGTNIVFWKQIKKTKADEQGEKKTETFPILRYFTVFNIDQVDGEAVDHLRASSNVSNSSPLEADYEAAQNVIDATKAEIRFGGDSAFYARPNGPAWPNHTAGDFIGMPPRDHFESPHEFYATSMHELCHWSEVRRDWTGSYAMGELIAEIGACFLCSEVGIPCTDKMDNHVAYLGEWLKALQNDERAILKAASQASKATEFILSFSRPKEPTPEELQTA